MLLETQWKYTSSLCEHHYQNGYWGKFFLKYTCRNVMNKYLVTVINKKYDYINCRVCFLLWTIDIAKKYIKWIFNRSIGHRFSIVVITDVNDYTKREGKGHHFPVQWHPFHSHIEYETNNHKLNLPIPAFSSFFNSFTIISWCNQRSCHSCSYCRNTPIN